VEDGRFALFFNREADLSQHPHLVQMAKAYNLHPPESRLKSDQRVYFYALAQLENYILAQAGIKPEKNYVKKVYLSDLKEVGRQLVEQLEKVVERYYHHQECIFSELVSESQGGASNMILFLIPQTTTVEDMANVLHSTQRELAPSRKTTAGEIVKFFKDQEDEDYGEDYKIFDSNDRVVLTLKYWGHSSYIQIGFARADPRILEHDETCYRNFGVFLRYLAFAKHDRKIQ
jgi:hypothetical protein